MSQAGQGGATLKLSVMMFLQFFLWGAWFVTLGPFMAALKMGGEASVGRWIANAYSTAPIAALIAPFFLGVVADRFFASQRVMAFLHGLGGLLLLAAPTVARTSVDNPLPFVGVLLAHMLCYMPTLGLSNTVAFHAMNHPERQFPLVRVWGTIGWIVAGFLVGMLARQVVPDGDESARAASPVFFYVAGASGVLLGLFSLALPHTPAPMKGRPVDVGAILGRDALILLKDRSFLVFAACSLLICIPLAAYYSFAATYVGRSGFESVPIKMTFGQMSEIFFMLVMPLFFVRLGVKWMLAVGMLAWVLRYGLFAAAWGADGANPDLKWMVLGGILLHGICYDFFFVTGQIYVEKRAGPQIRGQAQGFLVLITQGIGMFLGNQAMGRLVDHFTADGMTDWRRVWLAPALFAGVILLVFVALFKDGRAAEPGQASSPR
jgi:nucleoside transporter